MSAWEALPQRKRKERGNKAGAPSSSQNIESKSPKVSDECTPGGGSAGTGFGGGKADANFAQVEKNLAARSLKESSRIQATLEGRDGCAGEFYEYLDHTADVQFHVWGKTLEEAFANMAPCMFNFITELGKLEIGNESDPIELEVSGHDWHSLLFAYMDEMLFNFATDGFCSVKVDIKEFDRENFRIKANIYGCAFDIAKHVQGTEIKAITYSNMQVHEAADKAELYVIVDI